MKIDIDKFHNVKILVLGDIILDYYWMGDSERISPEAPIPVVKFHHESWHLGGAANVASNCHALGADVKLLGAIGQDEYGEHLMNLLEEQQIRSALTRIDGMPTTTKLRILAQNQQLLRVDFEEVHPLSETELERLLKEFEEAVTRVDAVILSDYQKGVLLNPQPFIEVARKMKKPVMIDPKGTDFSIYRGATVLTPNYKEFTKVFGECATQEEVYRKAQEALEAYDISAILLTQGKKGVSMIQRDSIPFQLNARTQEVVDITGAGDTLLAAFTCAIASGESVLRSCMLANLAAGISVSKLGTATVGIQELYYEHRGFSGISQVILNEDELMERVAFARREGKRIVMTNGCFDLIHPGHIHFLQEAKAMGDFLVVAVNDDNSVRRLKGKGRPVNDIAQRSQSLANLRCVDWVTVFKEDTPERLIKKIRPDVLVKGGDYSVEDIVGGEFVKAYGGVVKSLKYIEGMSSTNLIEMVERKRGQNGNGK